MLYICGIDEAGRGPLCGPVTAAAVLLDAQLKHQEIKDSKKISAKKRPQVAELVKNTSIGWGLGWVFHHEIDQINIHNASLLAMQRAWLDLEHRLIAHGHEKFLFDSQFEILVDGRFVPAIPHPVRAVIGGDATVQAISAASILAKTARDNWIADWCRVHDPGDRYEFLQHKGYPTARHREILAQIGPCEIHRKSFNLGIKQESIK
jgi:ribonuclease HII